MRTLIKVDPEELKIARLNNGWSIRELERKSNVSRATIIRLERGDSSAEAYTVNKLAKALSCSVGKLKGE